MATFDCATMVGTSDIACKFPPILLLGVSSGHRRKSDLRYLSILIRTPQIPRVDTTGFNRLKLEKVMSISSSPMTICPARLSAIRRFSFVEREGLQPYRESASRRISSAESVFTLRNPLRECVQPILSFVKSVKWFYARLDFRCRSWFAGRRVS